jgi:hypothetical protein
VPQGKPIFLRRERNSQIEKDNVNLFKKIAEINLR